ncbi:MAG: class I SAM-dependent methyltransferase, partial [Halobacteriaceae archaeon]
MPDGGDSVHTTAGDAVGAAQRFYTRHARLYDRLATAPGVGRVRERAVDALDLDRGETVVEFGCGTGANLPRLRERVGPTGSVVGVDFATGPLAVARERVAAEPNVAVCRGDATDPPLTAVGQGHGEVRVAASRDGTRPDAVLATFLAGMLPAPADAVAGWLDLLADGGRVALLDLAPSRGAGAPLNPLFDVVARLGSPPGTDDR